MGLAQNVAKSLYSKPKEEVSYLSCIQILLFISAKFVENNIATITMHFICYLN